ncbi:MAG: NADH-quinone oxidoreductase subunit NuoE [Planctomycetes bacterium]|nr:NADH-quinone oxidoreductase subunit NuoE [Planctomycetota bacterium]
MTQVDEIDLAGVDEVLSRFPSPEESDLIPILQQTQEAYGYLPAPVMQKISDVTRIPMARIYGVATFYAQFSFEPRAKHTIRCCRGTACHVKGISGVIDAIERELGIQEGESTPDLMFYLDTVACLGTCFLAPVIMIDDQYYGQLTAKRVGAILRSYREEET